MTELELIEEMCAEVPGPTEARVAAVRARVLDEVTRPAQPRPAPTGRARWMPDSRRAARAGRSAGNGRGARGGRGIRPLIWPRLAWTGAVAVALAIVLIVTGVIPLRSTPAQPASAAEVLHRAAAAALAQPSPTDRQLIYSQTTIYYATYGKPGSGVSRAGASAVPGRAASSGGKSSAGAQRGRRPNEVGNSRGRKGGGGAVARGGKSRAREREQQSLGAPTGHVTVRQEEWQSPTSPNGIYRTSPCDVDGDAQLGRGACSFEGGYAPGAQAYSTYTGLRRLPTSTGALLAYLAGLPSGGHTTDDREWLGANLIASLNPVLPPRFAAALFRAVAQIPGTALLSAATDAAGAHGIGIARTAAGMRVELIFNPGTYRLIGQQYTVLRQVHGHPANYVTSATALLHASFVTTGPGTSPHGTGASLGAPRNGQFIYTGATVLARLPAPSRAGRAPRLTLQRATQQMWQSVDGSKPGAYGTSPCRGSRAACLIMIPPGPQTPALTTYAGLAGLPRQPGALLTYLHQHNTCAAPDQTGFEPAGFRSGGGSAEWEMVTAMLGNNLVMPPGLGKVLFEAAARIAGSVVLPNVADAAGGSGIAVARNDTPGLRAELIFARRSYRFIGIQYIFLHRMPGLHPGAVWAAESLATAKVVDTAPVTSLSQVYGTATCGFIPGYYTAASSSISASSGPGSRAQGSSSGTGSPSPGSSSAPAPAR